MSVATPSRSSKCCEILFWNTYSCADFIPKGILVKQYLPNGVLNVVSSWSSNGICQCPCVAFNFENTLARDSREAISSTVGSRKCSRLMAWFRYFGSRHIRNFPVFGFSTITVELTQSVGLSTFRMTPCFSISSNSTFRRSLIATGLFLGGFTTGVMSGSSSIWYGWLKHPRPLKMLAYFSFISLQTKHAREFKEAWYSTDSNTINRHIDISTIYLQLKTLHGSSTNDVNMTNINNVHSPHLHQLAILVWVTRRRLMSDIYPHKGSVTKVCSSL